MSNNNTVAADTITNDQIRALRTEAASAGDSAMVDLCDLAMASREDANDDGTPLIGPCGGQTTRTEAREACADAINAGQG